ncbi:MAG: hypothetical protein ACXW3E_04135, partial [Thermoanaerobaculia bacterium]
VRDPFAALLALSVIAAALGAWLVALAAAELLGSDWAGGAAALVIYFSPAMLVFDALPNPEGLAVALIAAAILAMVRGNSLWFGILAAAAIGVRPEIAPAMFVMVLVFVLSGGGLLKTIAGFVVVLVLCFVPLVEAIGTSSLAGYARANYIALRTSSQAAGLHGRELLLRFIAHPWGATWTFFPLLIAAAIGFVITLRRARAPAATLAAFALAHVVFCLAFADRADGVQPVIPALVVIAIFAAAALTRWPKVAFAIAVAYAIAGFAYAWPVLHLRRTRPAPPAAAMRYARRVLPRHSVLLYEPSLEAWARFSRFDVAPIRDFDRYADRPGTPLFLLADGGSKTAGAAVFEWPDSDAYGKVTTDHDRVVSLIPLPPNTRYKSLGGLYSFERTADGREGRWLAGDAIIELPSRGSPVVHLRFALPGDAPIEENTISVNGEKVTVLRGQAADLAFRTSSPLRLHASRTFSSPRDQRSLAVQLIAVEQR